MRDIDNDSGLLRTLIGDGRPLLMLTAVMLFLSGAFAIFLSIRREFLPHDVAFLGMSAEALCAHADCRVVRFMFHDRICGRSRHLTATRHSCRDALTARGGCRRQRPSNSGATSSVDGTSRIALRADTKPRSREAREAHLGALREASGQRHFGLNHSNTLAHCDVPGCAPR